MSDIGTHGNNGDAEAAHESDVRVWVHKDDLIDDRALQNDADDEFRLADVVEEVAGLCEAASLPATVALYGSWGSGKSSLANLLAARFAHNRDVAFARFDAFKYAEVPLRRHFLSQVAKTFKVKDKKFDRGLYTSTKHVRLDMPARKWFALAGLILIAVAVTIGLASIAAFLVALVAPKGTLWANFTKTLEASVPAIALATPIIAAALTLLGQVFTADSTTDAPSSDEQFEALFSELVKAVVDKKKCKRIVIFIDELDRCSPRQVVAALETLRTFLEVKPCIFIVAADQQVLEHALTGAARQATPFNAANPYYSAGSGYLDKIFQYQLQLPPILTGRLSHYALRLIEGRQGVWSYLHNRPELVSVLIPTHVRSPRRVKVLLNAFALLYGLALRRAAEGVIEGVEERAAQVAKLVCLKTEFPLFAVDLQLDSRLPDIVLRLHEKEDEKAVKADYPGLSDEAFERAKGYANENRAVDQVIAQVVANPSGDGSPDLEADGARDVEASHAQQLLRYLQRTREIPSPQRDLVYLDSSGAAFGLPAELAEQLEFDALDGSTEDVAEAVEALDPDDQLKALRLLARLVVEAVGIEARNVAQALFAAIAVNSADIAPVADDLLNALVTYNSGYELEADDVVGALQLALSHDGAAALRMREEVVSRDEVLTETDLGLLVLAHLTQLRAHLARVALALTGLLERSGGAAAERALAGVADADVKALLEAVDLDAAIVPGMRDFAESAHTNERPTVARAAFTALIGSDEVAAGPAAGTLISLFAPITDAELASDVLSKGRTQPPSEWLTWLNAVDGDTARSLSSIDALLDDYVERIWSEEVVGSGSLTDEAFVATARALGSLRPAVERERGAASALFANLTPPLTVALAEARAELYSAAWSLADAGAVDRASVAGAILNDLAGLLAAAPAAAVRPALSEHVLEAGSEPIAAGPEDALAELAGAVESSAWIEADAQEILRTRIACGLRGIHADAAPPARATLDALVAMNTANARAALASWILVFEPAPPEVFDVLGSLLEGGRRPHADLASAVSTRASEWSPTEKADLVESLAADYVAAEVHDDVIRGAGLRDANPARATQTLVEAYKAATNNEQRERVLNLWDLLQPAGDEALRTLIDKIYLPLLKEGKGGAEIALNHFSLVQNPPTQAAKERVMKSIKAAAETEKLAKRADKLLRNAGWISGKRKWFRW